MWASGASTVPDVIVWQLMARLSLARFRHLGTILRTAKGCQHRHHQGVGHRNRSFVWSQGC
ncbi:hypothetical protein SLEP1_g37314 [Rubroshorea leprosula]|uniref:Uncharacterized protein n=1 Tax=Rubroshorea leprosula TaxID=152421 RepID=A0AAV5KU62_9ROSI|nr:hypothetical protein SLEP1_g37314 [Rubroshorea leprosula]